MAKRLAPRTGRLLGRLPPVHRALAGGHIGQRLHPAATDLPHIPWLAASLVDVFGPREARPLARKLVASGLVASVPAAATGVADWADGPRSEQGAGLVHAALAAAGTAGYAASWWARHRSHHGWGIALAIAGGCVTVVSDYLGGYLALVRGVALPQHVVGAERSGPVRGDSPAERILGGDWFGHALHPVLSDVAHGGWLGATLADAIGGPGSERAARRLLTFGMIAAVPTLLSGWVDWRRSPARHRRLGAAHGAVSFVALACYGGSLLERHRGRERTGVVLSALGAVAVVATGYLGGELTVVHGVGVEPSWDRAASNAATSSSDVWVKSSYQEPTA